MITSLDHLLEGVCTVGIAGHVRPDGDCAGSALAVYNYIKTWYSDVQVDLYLEPIPNVFQFLSRSEEICSEYPERAPYDLFLALDCGDLARLGEAGKYFTRAKKTACVDHHKSNQSFAMENLIVSTASSTSELVYGLMDQKRITKEIAECIYVGIVHDTGVFQFSCTSAKTMEIAGRLMDMGIDFPTIVDDTFYTKTFEENRILGLALTKSRLHLDGFCISSMISKAEMEAYHVTTQDLSGIVQALRVTKGADVAVFLYESDTDTYKVSMRSKKQVDVAEIAMKYGGGGHARAAGVTMQGDPDGILEQIVQDIAGAGFRRKQCTMES